MRIRIEKLKKRDLPHFYSLFKKALFEDFKEYSPEVAAFQWKRHQKRNLLKWVKTGEEYIFLAKEKDSQVIGILASQKIIGGVSNCDWLIISRENRGQGIGLRLLLFWEGWVKRNKGHLLTLSADKKNLEFYQRNGFKEYGYLKDGYFNNSDYLMYKRVGKWNKKSLSL